MRNIIPRTIPALRVTAVCLANGAKEHGATIPLVVNTAALIASDMTSLVNAETAFETAKHELSVRHASMRETRTAARTFATVGRDIFKPRLRTRYNQKWDPTGLLHSLKIPRNEKPVLALLGSFKEFLAANPDFQMGHITAAQAGALFTQLKSAMAAVDAQKTIVKNLLRDRDAKFKALRKRVSDTIAELKMRLDRRDPRWMTFGLNMPGAVQTPQPPAEITAKVIGPNAVSIEWPRSKYASYYRVWRKVAGVDQEFVNIDNATKENFTIPDLPPGAEVEIAVSAVAAEAGESLLSASIKVELPSIELPPTDLG